MKDGFIKAATATPALRVADPQYNSGKIIEMIKETAANGTALLVFPELSVTGYTCGDLFGQRPLTDATLTALDAIRKATIGTDMLVFVGAPIRNLGKLYNCAVAFCNGDILGVIPKKNLPNYNEFYEKRNFEPAPYEMQYVTLFGKTIPFGTDILFRADCMQDFTVSAEICEDLWVVNPPSLSHAAAGSTVIVNLSASNETVGKAEYRRLLVCEMSARTVSAYLYADAGSDESTTDLVFSGHSLIAENGNILSELPPFTGGLQYTVIDCKRLADERQRMGSFPTETEASTHLTVPFSIIPRDTETPQYPKRPFVPSNKTEFSARAESILAIQTAGLRKRLAHTGAKTAVVGISGGLDSTLALLVAIRAMDALERPHSDVLAVTMPCFGTTARTKSNAVTLAEALGATVMTVDIQNAVRVHLSDIGHEESLHDVTYENAQARERTQVLMDIANNKGGLVIGTGDLSEVALGWSTYNGDHMAMYGVNASVPKTLIRYLVGYYAEALDGPARTALLDILDTPVSPELLPAKDGEIVQKTEDIVGPYDLHDFFLYYAIRMSFSPKKLFRVACRAFEDEFAPEVILKWEKQFFRRFFTQQFKRSCMPDGPKVGSVALSPRGDLRMPSDASYAVWQKELEEIIL